MTLYAYSDETEFKRSESDSTTIIGTGIFTSKDPILDCVIDEALSNLNGCDKKNEMDLKTIKRGYFHASKDSSNAHSCLCDSINKNIKGVFRYSFHECKNQKSWEKYDSNESINRLTLGLAALEFYSGKIDKVILTIENRKGFGKTAAEKLINVWNSQLDMLAYKQTSFMTYYPNFEIIFSDKLNPGLQITDFILWILNRAHKTKVDETWKKRINFKAYSDFHENEGSQIGGNYYLNEISIDRDLKNYPFKPTEPESNDQFYQAYLNIEQTVRQICNLDLPDNMQHLKSMLPTMKRIFDNDKNLDYDTLHLMASIYIRFFDTLPIYSSIDNEDEIRWTMILRAKKMAGLFLRKDLIHGIRSCNAVLSWRKEILNNNKEILICT